MNEIIVFAVVVLIVVLAQFLIKRIKKPLSSYIKIVSVIAFLILIWFLGKEGQLPMKIIVSAIMLTGLYREFLSLKKASL